MTTSRVRLSDFAESLQETDRFPGKTLTPPSLGINILLSNEHATRPSNWYCTVCLMKSWIGYILCQPVISAAHKPKECVRLSFISALVTHDIWLHKHEFHQHDKDPVVKWALILVLSQGWLLPFQWLRTEELANVSRTIHPEWHNSHGCSLATAEGKGLSNEAYVTISSNQNCKAITAKF